MCHHFIRKGKYVLRFEKYIYLFEIEFILSKIKYVLSYSMGECHYNIVNFCYTYCVCVGGGGRGLKKLGHLPYQES